MEKSKDVAIIGSGAAGISTLWALENYSAHNVYLYEATDRLGGHSNTVVFKKQNYSVPVDTGFIVLNTATYPNFLSFLRIVNVPTVNTEMTFSVSRNWGLFEWAGTSLRTIFAQSKNIISVKMWQMLFDIIRFNTFATDLLRNEELGQGQMLTVLEYLDREGYSESFRDNYLIPMTAAIWSTSPGKGALEFPAVTLIRFMWNHHLLDTISRRPQWLTLKHGAKSYIDAVMADFPADRVFLNQPVTSVANDSSGHVVVVSGEGTIKKYDHVILATHGPQALSIISSSATKLESDILSSFHTSPNMAILHSDATLMPQNRMTWSAWNYLTTGDPSQVCLTYNMNKLQCIPMEVYGPVLVTLNPLRPPDKNKVQGSFSYAHPIYTPKAMRAQDLLHTIQGTRGISYAGAWTKYGFHEDAFTSGFSVAVNQLGAKLPFQVIDSKLRRGSVPALRLRDHLLRICVQSLHLILLLIAWAVGSQA